VSSVALIKLCWEKARCTWTPASSPWPGGYIDPTVPPPAAPITRLREEALALRAGQCTRSHRVLTHGANPAGVALS